MTHIHTSQPVVLGPEEGRKIPGPEGLTLKVTGEQSNGSIGLVHGVSEPGFGGPRHIHRTSDELFYVLGGEFRFLVADEEVAATKGSVVFVPRGTTHAPRVVGPEPGRVLIIFTPGGQERAFEEFAALAARLGEYDLDHPDFQAIVAKYDSEIVGPPI